MSSISPSNSSFLDVVHEKYQGISSGIFNTTQDVTKYAGRKFQQIKLKVIDTIDENKDSLLNAAREAQRIAIYTIAGCGALFLFMTNSSLFLFGALYTYFDKERMKTVLSDMKTSWQNAPLPIKVAAVAGGILAWPSLFAVSSFLLGGVGALYLMDIKQTAEENQQIIRSTQEPIIDHQQLITTLENEHPVDEIVEEAHDENLGDTLLSDLENEHPVDERAAAAHDENLGNTLLSDLENEHPVDERAAEAHDENANHQASTTQENENPEQPKTAVQEPNKNITTLEENEETV